MMMLAVMYGMMPSTKTLNCSRAPPENMLYRPNNEFDCWENHSASTNRFDARVPE